MFQTTNQILYQLLTFVIPFCNVFSNNIRPFFCVPCGPMSRSSHVRPKTSQGSQAAAGSKASLLGHFGRSSLDLQKDFPNKTLCRSSLQIDPPVVDFPGKMSGGFRSHGGTPKSSILNWDFPENNPSSYWGTPILGNPKILGK